MKLNVFHYLIFFPGVLFMAWVFYINRNNKNHLLDSDLPKILNILEMHLTHLKYKKHFWRRSEDNYFLYTFYGKSINASYEIDCHTNGNYLKIKIFNITTEKTIDLEFTLFIETGLDYEDFEKRVSSHLS